MSSWDSRTPSIVSFFFFFNDTATTEIYTLSLHDALPISVSKRSLCLTDADAPRVLEWTRGTVVARVLCRGQRADCHGDRKSTRLNSSHDQISYAVFCLKKKTKQPLPSARRLRHCPQFRRT